MSDQEKSTGKRKYWSKDEIRGLLKCYLARKDEFLTVRGKRTAYQNVLQDMISQGIVSPNTTVDAIKGKLTKLSDAYKSLGKDNTRNTNATKCFAEYADEIDEIFGNKAKFQYNHTFHLGSSSISTKIELPSDNENENDDLLVPLHIQPPKVGNSRKRRIPEKFEKEEIDFSEEDLLSLQPKIKVKCEHPQNDPRKKKVWSREETLGLLQCYGARQHEFLQSRIKKFAYANVLKDMVEQGIAGPDITVNMVAEKLKKMLAMYRAAKKNPVDKYSKSLVVAYMKDLDKVFGDGNEDIDDNDDQFNSSNNRTATEDNSDTECSEDESAVHSSTSSFKPHVPKQSSTKTNLTKEDYYTARLEQKKEQFEKKLAAKQAQRAEFFRLGIEALEKHRTAELEIEKQKLALLEDLLRK